MRNHGEIKVFKMGTESLVSGIVFTQDYISHVRQAVTHCKASSQIVGMFEI